MSIMPDNEIPKCPDVLLEEAETLAGVAIFRDLAPEAVAALSGRCTWRRYAAGQLILPRDRKSRDAFFIVRGRACSVHSSASGREVRFCDLVAGDIFGDFASGDGEPLSADIVSATDTLIAGMSGELFREVLHDHKAIGPAILRRLTRMARAQTQRLLELTTLPVRTRVYAELLRLARTGTRNPTQKSAIIAPAPTHAELASRISTHREAVSRELSRLARAKVVERRGGKLVIHDMAALVRLVEKATEEPCDCGISDVEPSDFEASDLERRKRSRWSDDFGWYNHRDARSQSLSAASL